MSEQDLETDEKSPRRHTEIGPSAPSAPNGTPDGAPARPVPAVDEPSSAASDASHRQPGGPAPAPGAATDAAVHAALAGVPGTLPSTWCKKCAADVVPVGKGRCPRCQTFLQLNFVARRHPVNKLRRQQLLDKFVIDYRPDTQRLQSMCEQLAGIVEQLEVLKPGSPEHQRLVQLSQLLGAALEESRSSRVTRTTTSLNDLSSDELIARFEFLTATARRLRLRDAEQPKPSNNDVSCAPSTESNDVEQIAERNREDTTLMHQIDRPHP